jgi:large subunit ribosomal protein L9
MHRLHHRPSSLRRFIFPLNLTTTLEFPHASHPPAAHRPPWPDGRCRQSQRRFCPQLPAATGQGAPRQQRQPGRVRKAPGRSRSQQPRAEAVSTKLAGKQFVTIRQAGDTGQLYGSVSTRDIADSVIAGGFTVDRRQITLDKPIKTLGVHEVTVALHPEVLVKIGVNVARSEDEAARQARGEDVTMVKEEKMEIETFKEDDDYDDRRGGRDDRDMPPGMGEQP